MKVGVKVHLLLWDRRSGLNEVDVMLCFLHCACLTDNGKRQACLKAVIKANRLSAV